MPAIRSTPIPPFRGVTFHFYGNCRETARLRTISIVRPGAEQKDLDTAFAHARRKLISPRLIHQP